MATTPSSTRSTPPTRSRRWRDARITISHTRTEGTIVNGTARGDGTAAILKAAGFRWAPSLRAWIIAQSRDQAAKTWKIDRAAADLRAVGFEVKVSIDETPRAFAEAEAERQARTEVRADRYAERAERASAAAAAAHQAAHAELDLIPLGQPILVGHHSERSHRAALNRIDQRMRRSIEEDAKATHYQRAATVAGRYTQRREALGTTLRRIDKLEAAQRQIDRYIAEGRAPEGSDYRARLDANHAQNADELAHWRQVVADLVPPPGRAGRRRAGLPGRAGRGGDRAGRRHRRGPHGRRRTGVHPDRPRR